MSNHGPTTKRAIQNRKVEDFPYRVSNTGKLWRIWHDGSHTVMQCPIDPVRGHRMAHLRDGAGKSRTTTLHTIVLETFVGPRPKGWETKFLDDNPANCALSNLQWVPITVRDNIPKGEKHYCAKLTAGDVIEVRRRAALGEKVEHMADEYGIHPGALRSAVNGSRWKHLPGAIKRKSGPSPLPPELKAPRLSRAKNHPDHVERMKRANQRHDVEAARNALKALLAARADEAESFANARFRPAKPHPPRGR